MRGLALVLLLGAIHSALGADAPKPAIAAPEASAHRMIDITRAGEALIAVGQHGVILRKTVGGSWKQVSSPVDVMLTRVHMRDALRGWILGYQQSILETKDGGASWNLRQFDAGARALNDLLFLDADHGITVGAYGSMMETRDGGASWQELDNALTDLGVHLNVIARLADGSLLVAGERGFMARSTDVGASWTLIDFPYAGSLYGLILQADKGVVAYGMRGNVLVAPDITACKIIDADLWDPYERLSLEEPDALAELGWRKIASPVAESLFGHWQQADGDRILVGLNANVLKLDADASRLVSVPVEESETLTRLIATGETFTAVGRRGILDLGRLE